MPLPRSGCTIDRSDVAYLGNVAVSRVPGKSPAMYIDTSIGNPAPLWYRVSGWHHAEKLWRLVNRSRSSRYLLILPAQTRNNPDHASGDRWVYCGGWARPICSHPVSSFVRKFHLFGRSLSMWKHNRAIILRWHKSELIPVWPSDDAPTAVRVWRATPKAVLCVATICVISPNAGDAFRRLTRSCLMSWPCSFSGGGWAPSHHASSRRGSPGYLADEHPLDGGHPHAHAHAHTPAYLYTCTDYLRDRPCQTCGGGGRNARVHGDAIWHFGRRDPASQRPDQRVHSRR